MWWQPTFLTLQLMAVSVVISGAIGVLGAWAASSLESDGRLGKRLARVFFACMVAAIALPMVLHAAAWEATAGKFGWLPLTQTGSRSTAIGAFGAFGGLLASSWIHGLAGAAVVALATWHGVRRIPEWVVAQSRLERGPIDVWWRIRLPLAAPWLITSLMAVAALAATEMTVVDLYGYRTVADEFYLFFAKNAKVATILAVCYLPLALASYLLVRFFVWRRPLPTFNQRGDNEDDAGERLSGPLFFLAASLAILIALVIVLVPVAGLVVKSGHQVMVDGGTRTATWSARQCFETLAWAPVTFVAEYRWTALIALLAGTTAVALAWLPAAVGRTQRRLGQTFDLLTVLMVLMPGPIIGLGVVSFFQLNVPGFKVVYQQTLLPVTIALSFRAIPIAYWILRAGYRGVDQRVFDAASLERTWLRRWWSIDRPLMTRSLMVAFLASATFASGDVPAMLLVIPPGVTTVGTRLYELLHNGARYQEAALALWYVAAVMAVAAIWLKWGTISRGTMK